MWDVIIVGAGISGLSARAELVARGRRVLTLEKSRGLSGRAASRRASDGLIADLGAQFFSAKNPPLQTILRSDPAGLKEIRLNPDSKHARYVHEEGMSRLARKLTDSSLLKSDSNAPILTGTKVISFKAIREGWQVGVEPRAELEARAVILSAPLPQAIELLGEVISEVDPAQVQRLRAVEYTCCLAGLFVLSAETGLAAPGILKDPSPRISGIYEQAKKGVKTSVPVLVVHGSPQMSLDFWDKSETEAIERLWNEAVRAAPTGALPSYFIQSSLKKWKYCEPRNPLAQPFERLKIPGAGPFYLVGDAFGGARIEGAFDSGRMAAMTVLTAPVNCGI
jgi:predicted NAD/FAD-dependent oxidoreductase